MEIDSIVYISGTNANTPFLQMASGGHPGPVRLTNEASIRPQDFLIVVDMNRHARRVIKKFRLSPSQCILIRQEPEIVCPANYSVAISDLFGKVIDVGRSLATSTLSIPWPQAWPKEMPHESSIENRLNSNPVLMNANKLSFVEGELYSLRRKLIHSQEIDLYGPGWDASFYARMRTLLGELFIYLVATKRPSSDALARWFEHHPNYLGRANNKIETYSQYKIVLAIENSADYVSEKLLDAIFAGCIPVYVGPNVTNFGIPKELVVESLPTIERVAEAIALAKSMDYASWFEGATRYLQNETAKVFWSPEQAFLRVLDHIRND